jgi:hypothetical protein
LNLSGIFQTLLDKERRIYMEIRGDPLHDPDWIKAPAEPVYQQVRQDAIRFDAVINGVSGTFRDLLR